MHISRLLNYVCYVVVLGGQRADLPKGKFLLGLWALKIRIEHLQTLRSLLCLTLFCRGFIVSQYFGNLVCFPLSVEKGAVRVWDERSVLSEDSGRDVLCLRGSSFYYLAPSFPPEDSKQTQIPMCCGITKANPWIMYIPLNTLRELQSTVFYNPLKLTLSKYMARI